MKIIIVCCLSVALLATLITSVPVNNAEIEQQLRSDIGTFLYENLLSNLFTGFVQTTMSSLSSFVNNIIQENPLGLGKRELEEARIDFNVGTFLYDNILSQLFSGLVTNTFSTIAGTLNHLITTNPLGVGKRSADEQSRIDFNVGTFLYDNILSQLFSGLVTNTFSTIAGTLNHLITTNPLGVGKRAISVWDFLYDNIAAQLFGGLVSNAANLLQNTLVDLIQTNPLGLGRRSLNGAQQIIEQSIAKLVAQFKLFANEALSALASNDKQKVQTLVKSMIDYVKVNVAQLSQQLGNELIGVLSSDVAEKVDKVLETLRTMFIVFSNSLGSLGPVIGPFPQ